jgi:group I intron endonuclease
MIVIYCIWNNITEKCYIGSSIDYNRRIRQHLRLLKRNVHNNKYLQNAWNKYEEKNFDIFILKVSTKENLLNDEQWCLDLLKPEYNFCKIAGNTLGLKWTSERREKQLKYLSNKTELHIENIRKALRNNPTFVKMATERCKQMCENNKKPILVLDLENNILHEFNSIIEASKGLQINKNNIQSRLSKIVKSPYQGKLKFMYKKEWQK